MNLIWRTLLHYFRTSQKIASTREVSYSRFRVLPTDLDLNGHMNNGRYLSISDIGRIELLQARGLWKPMRKKGWYPVVVSSTISFRKSLRPWRRFELESRFAGAGEKNVFLEHRFTVGGEIYAKMMVALRFLKDSGGNAPMDELTEFLELENSMQAIPRWAARWAEDVKLPSTRDAAVSDWK
ncbi:MAG: thioesterase family protein [Homoserinimonas sp.]|nr:thioesterase family protein [Homoserinimonas sp.]